jgi:P-type Mg2+ transporter
MTIATDSVDPEAVDRPRRWDVRFIRSFMVTFGILSSVFDFMTFGVLLLYLKVGMDQFRTGWFLESVVSACMIVLVVRSRRPFYRSRPSRYLLLATLAVIGITLALPYTPLGPVFGLPALPIDCVAALGTIIVLYIVVADRVKRVFCSRVRA